MANDEGYIHIHPLRKGCPRLLQSKSDKQLILRTC